MRRALVALLLLGCEAAEPVKVPPPEPVLVRPKESLTEICKQFADAREGIRVARERNTLMKAELARLNAEKARLSKFVEVKKRLNADDLPGALAAMPEADLLELLRQLKEDKGE